MQAAAGLHWKSASTIQMTIVHCSMHKWKKHWPRQIHWFHCPQPQSSASAISKSLAMSMPMRLRSFGETSICSSATCHWQCVPTLRPFEQCALLNHVCWSRRRTALQALLLYRNVDNPNGQHWHGLAEWCKHWVWFNVPASESICESGMTMLKKKPLALCQNLWLSIQRIQPMILSTSCIVRRLGPRALRSRGVTLQSLAGCPSLLPSPTSTRSMHGKQLTFWRFEGPGPAMSSPMSSPMSGSASRSIVSSIVVQMDLPSSVGRRFPRPMKHCLLQDPLKLAMMRLRSLLAITYWNWLALAALIHQCQDMADLQHERHSTLPLHPRGRLPIHLQRSLDRYLSSRPLSLHDRIDLRFLSQLNHQCIHCNIKCKNTLEVRDTSEDSSGPGRNNTFASDCDQNQTIWNWNQVNLRQCWDESTLCKNIFKNISKPRLHCNALHWTIASRTSEICKQNENPEASQIASDGCSQHNKIFQPRLHLSE